MHLMIFYPGGVSQGFPIDIEDDDEIRDMMFTAATIEEGNGNAKKVRRNKTVDDRHSE